MQQNYEQLVDRIAKSAGIEVDEVQRKIEAKRAKLSGLISQEGAAQIVAAELGISFEKQKLKISEFVPGMRKVNTVGKIINLFPVREYNKNDRSGKIGSMVIADDSGNIRTVLWDTNHISLIEKGDIKQDDVVEITNASIRNNELHLGGFSDIKKSNEKIENPKTEKSFTEKKLSDSNIGESINSRAIIVQVFEPRLFEVCPECSKKVVDGVCSGEHDKVVPKKRALLNIVLDDGTNSIRAILFNEQINSLGINDEEIQSTEKFLEKREELLGKEAIFSGNIRKNKMFNNPEFFIDSIKEVNIEEIIEQLQK